MNFALILFFLLIPQILSIEDGLVGLGGFIKVLSGQTTNAKNVDLSQVEVELLTDTGVRKFVTECTPNGFFYIPVEDPGFYIVRPRGSIGWTFTPTWRRVECGTSVCNSDNDVNFQVNGFSVRGKVLGCDSDYTAENTDTILMSLTSKDNDDYSASLYCNKDGSFEFTGVMPQTYILKASHPKWELIEPEEEVEIEVLWEAKDLQSSYIVKGYEIKGYVYSKSQPISDIVILMHCPSCSASERSYCSNNVKIEDFSNYSVKNDVVCATKTDSKGEFIFKTVPCGEFTLSSHYVSGETAFVLSPDALNVKVNGYVFLDSAFTVSGFSARGNVLHYKNKSPVSQASVKINNGILVTQTDDNGDYIISNLKTEESTIQEISASKEGIKFSIIKNFEINFSSPIIPPIYATHYSVCGQIITKPISLSQQKEIEIYRSSNISEVYKKTYTDNNGRYCSSVEPGSYIIKVLIEKKDRESGLMLGPDQHEIEIIDKPLLNIDFNQKRVSIKIDITKLPENSSNSKDTWKDIKIYFNDVLKTTLSGGKYEEDTQRISLNEDDDNNENLTIFTIFKNLVPGKYIIKVEKDGWCFKENKIIKTVLHDTLFSFRQKGFLKKVKISHPTQLSIDRRGEVTSFIKKQYEADSTLEICMLPEEPVHITALSNCFIFNDEKITLRSDTPSDIFNIFPTNFKTFGKIKSLKTIELEEIKVDIKYSSTKKLQQVIAYRDTNDINTFTYNVIGDLDEDIQIYPNGENLFFFPKSISFIHPSASKVCAEELQTFMFKAGTFVTGKIYPPVLDATVELYNSKGGLEGSILSDRHGLFKFGPFIDDKTYDVKIKKSGYEFELKNKLISNNMEFSFKSNKLSKIEVEVSIDDTDKESIVVLLTGGDSFRQTKQTDETGSVIFWNCPPSTKEYYIKPLFREYAFTPSSQLITVKEGKDEKVIFSARRNAFSVYGKIKSLNKKVMGGITVQAKGSDDLYEIATSADTGGFRLRGLQPLKKYNISIIPQGGVEMWWPKEHIVSVTQTGEIYIESLQLRNDIKQSVDFIVYRNLGIYTVTGNIDIKREDYLNATIIEIYKVSKESIVLTKPIITESCDSSGWFEFKTKIFGHYVIQPKNNFLKNCKGNTKDIILSEKQTKGREINVGTLDFDCHSIKISLKNLKESESSLSMLPVLITIISVVIIQFRNKIKSLIF